MAVKCHFICNSYEVNIFIFKKTAERKHSVSNILSVAICSDSNYLKKKKEVEQLGQWHNLPQSPLLSVPSMSCLLPERTPSLAKLFSSFREAAKNGHLDQSLF